MREDGSMTDLNKEREAFEASESISTVIHKFEWSETLNSYKLKDCLEKENIFELTEAVKQLPFLNGSWYGWLLAKAHAAKAQAVPNPFINEIQSWVAVQSIQAMELDGEEFVVGANELAEFIEQLVKSESGAQAVPETHILVEKSKIETWWQDAEEPENFASSIEDVPSLGHYLAGDEIMEITEHHTIHLPSKTIYGVWVDKDGDRSFCTGTMEECQALVGRESGAEG